MSELLDSDGSTDSTASSPGAIHEFYDPGHDETIGYAIVTAVAAARRADPVDLPPLYDSVDVDALDALVVGASDRTTGTEGRATFAYAGFEITVDFDGWIRLDPVDD